MKNVSLSLKYSLLFLPSLVLIAFIMYMVNVPPETIVISTIAMVLVYAGTILFIKEEVQKPLKASSYIAREISSVSKDDDETEEAFEEKISDISEILDKLDFLKENRFAGKEIIEVYNCLHTATERLSNELERAKTFRINRNEFFGNVAHELRTPIFAIQLSLETLLDGAINDEEVNKDFLKRASLQADRLKDLVNDLVSISKIESGMKLSKRYFGISDHISGIINEMKGIAENRNISINYDNKLKNGVQVFGDSESLKQVFVNLIDNSIKYTPQGGSIIIRTKEDKKDVIISIEDNGIGIPHKDIPRIFERFYRVDKNRSRDRGGTGLGLSIVKHILEAHESKIKVESEVEKGTKFTFALKK